MDDTVRRGVITLVSERGLTEICDDPGRCRAFLRDLYPDHRLEVNVLVAAVEEDIPQGLSEAPHAATQVPRFVQRLTGTRALSHEAALWAVETWLLAATGGSDLAHAGQHRGGQDTPPPPAPENDPVEYVEVKAKSIDLAVAAAVDELGLKSQDEAIVEVIHEPKPGVLGLGAEDAIVRVRPKRAIDADNAEAPLADGTPTSPSRESPRQHDPSLVGATSPKPSGEESATMRFVSELARLDKLDQVYPNPEAGEMVSRAVIRKPNRSILGVDETLLPLAEGLSFIGVRFSFGSLMTGAAVRADGLSILDLSLIADRVFRLNQSWEHLTADAYFMTGKLTSVTCNIFFVFENGAPEETRQGVKEKELDRRELRKKRNLVSYVVDLADGSAHASRRAWQRSRYQEMANSIVNTL